MQFENLFSQAENNDDKVVYDKDSGPVQNPVFSDRESQGYGS